jgi:ABC-type molybdate transport system substrate-binding protein
MTYTAGVLVDAPHRQAAQDFLAFLRSGAGQAVYRQYGFLPPE